MDPIHRQTHKHINMTDSPTTWLHQKKTELKNTPLVIHKSGYLKHRKLCVHVYIESIAGKIFLMFRWNGEEADGSPYASHIFECPPVFVNGQIIPWSDDIFQGIKNHRHFAKNKSEMRSIKITDSNYFNELLLAHINR
jgi:hypothetical protein